MSTAAFNYHYDPVLPWTDTRNDERFTRIVRWVLLVFIIIGSIVPFLPSPQAEKQQLKQVAPRLAKLITEKKKKPPVPPVQKVKKLEPKKKVEKKVTKKKAEARKKAQKSGLMAMSKDIQDLQSMFDLSSLANTKPLKTDTQRKTTKKESVLTSKAASSSGGIDTSKLSRTTGNTNLAGRTSSQVSSNIGTSTATSTRNRPASTSSRTDEELTLVFDTYKGKLETIYQRALRRDPTLQGKVVFEITISPDGQVVKCRIVSSELGSKSVERKMVTVVKSFRFKAKNVSTVTVTYPVDFLPS